MTNAQGSSVQRLDVLDGMRGLAAMMVVFYHYLARWAEPQFSPTLYAHGDAVATFLPLQLAGSVGVQLFFLISGFVIMMTLERSSGVLDFAAKRIARLWPTMLICATLSTLLINTSGVAFVYENVARWQVTPVEYFSSILFFPPDLFAELFSIEQSDTPRWVEGVYWTLWSEVRFYALVALAFWLSPKGTFIWVWLGVQAVSLVLDVVQQILGGTPSMLGPLSLAFQPDMLGWFTLGLVSWKWRSSGASFALILLSIIACLSILFGPVVSLDKGSFGITDYATGEILLLIMVGVPFGLFLSGSRLLKPLTWPPVIAIGLASYPLYLFHEIPGMIYMHWLNSAGIHPWVSVIVSILTVIATALIIHRIVENPGRRLLLKHTLGTAQNVQTRFTFLRMPGNRS